MKNFPAIGFLLFYVLFSIPGSALPRFTSSTNLKCQNCHIDPNGGGMRNYYGAAMYGREILPVRAWSNDSTMNNFTTRLSDFISIGLDMQTLFTYQQQRDYTSFYQMQGDLYISARIANNILLSMTKSLYHDFEIFGIASILPASGYIKVGRFTPAYGTRIDDHTTFIRTKTVFPLYRREDTGIEVGISPASFTWNTGLYNGEDGSDPSNGWVRLVTTRAEAFFRFEDVNCSLGGSAWYNNGLLGTLTMYGGFAEAGYKDATIHAEVDIKKDNTTLKTTELISYLEINYLIFNGIDLKFIYDFYDPDINYKTGSESRFSFGAEFFPLPGVEVRPLYRIQTRTPGDVRQNEFDLLLHLFL
jgi:hypothetical protein